MPELDEDVVKKSKLRHERKLTHDEIMEIKTHLSIHGKILTRLQLVEYLRKTAARIHADIIQISK